MPLGADDLERALAGEVIETSTEAGGTEIDIARDHGDGVRHRRIEEHDLGVEPFGREVAFLDGDIAGAAANGLGATDLDAFG